jgi:hypothetical protein
LHCGRAAIRLHFGGGARFFSFPDGNRRSSVSFVRER